MNVLIGVNGTGKTHILKMLYAACAITVGEGKEKFYTDKLRDVFMPYGGKLDRIFRRPVLSDEKSLIGILRDNHMDMICSFKVKGEAFISEQSDNFFWTKDILESVYIPVKEMLAHAPGFISLTAKREIAFEEVYVNTIKLAYLPKLKALPNQMYAKLHSDLGKAIGGEVILKGEHFFLKNEQGEFEFSLLAEGVRKLALIWLLIQNGTLNPGSVLFWDEPEANMNPSLVGLIVETLLELQRQGVQVFLTTHNYVLLKEFDLRKRETDAVRFISLYRDESGAVNAQTTDDYLAIQPNAIAETFDGLYDREIKRSLTGV